MYSLDGGACEDDAFPPEGNEDTNTKDIIFNIKLCICKNYVHIHRT